MHRRLCPLTSVDAAALLDATHDGLLQLADAGWSRAGSDTVHGRGTIDGLEARGYLQRITSNYIMLRPSGRAAINEFLFGTGARR